MKAELWLTISGKKLLNGSVKENGVKVYKKKPSTGPNEVAMKLSLELPDSLFTKPVLEAVVKVPDNSQNFQLTDEQVHVVQEVLMEQIGLYVEVKN